jgi:hypothetical protein
MQRNHLRQRMTDVGGFDAMLGQQLGLEREDAQHMVGRAADFLHAIGTPGPDRRADKVHGLDAGFTQAGFQPQVEVGRIHTDEHRGRMRNQALTQLFANTEQLGHARQHFPAVAVHGQAL